MNCYVKPRIPTIGGTVLFRAARKKEAFAVTASTHSAIPERGEYAPVCGDCPERQAIGDEAGIYYACDVQDCEAYESLTQEYEADRA